MCDKETMKKRIEDNNICFKKVDNFSNEHIDIYSAMASEVFNVPYDDCLEYNMNTMEWNNLGKIRRTAVKYICLNRNSVDDIIEMYEKDLPEIKNLKKLIRNAFPFTFYDELEEDSTEEDYLMSTTFMISAFGYIRMIRYKNRHILVREVLE